MRKVRTITFSVKRLSNNINRLLDSYPIQSIDMQLTGRQCGIINYIGDRFTNQDIFQKDIESEFNIRRSTATGILQIMEKNGLIKRESLTCDARLKRIILTQKGINTKTEVEQKMNKAEAKVTKNLTTEEIDIFYEIIDKISKELE